MGSHSCTMDSCSCTMNSNCTNCTCSCDCGPGVAAAVLVPLLLEAVIIGVVIGLVLWKRIKVAEFLYNLQLPKLTDLPQRVIRRWRPAPSSSPPPDVYIERTVNNPTYDLEEGELVNIAKAVEAQAPTDIYELPNENGMTDQQGGCDVYDIPEVLGNDQSEAYATTADLFCGEMFDPYAITDLSQTEGQHGAYAVTDVPVGELNSEKQSVVTAEVHSDNRPGSSTTGKATADDVQLLKQTTPQRNVITVTTDTAKAKPPRGSKKVIYENDATVSKDRARGKPDVLPAKPTHLQKEIADTGQGKTPATKSTAVLRYTNAVTIGKSGSVEPSSDSNKVKNIRVRFEDEEHRRSKSYTGAGREEVIQQESSGKSSAKSLVKGKPKPLPKKKGILHKKVRERGSSDSGVGGYSQLDLKSQYASLEPHRGKELNSKEDEETKLTRDSYSHLKH